MSRNYVLTLMVLAGCSSNRQDSLAREKASMEAERKALSEHKVPPLAVRERPGGSLGKGGIPTGIKLPAGTQIRIVTTQPMSSRSAATGDEWMGKLSQDLKDPDGKVLAKAGSEIKGRMVLVSDGSNLRRKHELEVRVHRLQSISGDSVDVRTTSFVREGADGGRRPAIIETGTSIDFQLASETLFP